MPAGNSKRAALERHVRTLPDRHGGRRVVLALAAVVLVAFALRAYFATEVIDNPLPDSVGYTKIAAALYEDGRYGPPGLERRNTYSPGTPLFAAAIYYATGGVKPLLVRLVIAVLGATTVLFAYLIGRRLAGPVAGLVATLPVAVYPALLEYHGMLMTEPMGAFCAAGSMLAFLWASDEGRPARSWLLPGVALGATAMVRPEYVVFGFAFALLALVRVWRRGSWQAGIAAGAILLAAFVIPIAPWTIRNESVLHRFVPISTGGGQAAFIGTYLPGYQSGGGGTVHSRVLAELEKRYPNLERDTRRRYPNFPASRPIILGQALEVVAARRYPGVPSDVALTRMARHNFFHYWSSQPLDYLGFFAGKAWDMWKTGIYTGKHPVMGDPGWIVFHDALVLLALVGLAVLAWQRRWEALVLGVLIGGVTLLGALILASPRRVLVLVPELSALAGAGTVWLAAQIREHRASPAGEAGPS